MFARLVLIAQVALAAVVSTAQAPLPELRVVATHRPTLTVGERELLTVKRDQLAESAKALKYTIEWRGETCYIVDRNLFDAELFESVPLAFLALHSLASKGSMKFTLGDLGEEDRARVRQLLFQTGGAGLIGPAIMEGNTPASFGLAHSLTLVANGKEVTVQAHQDFAELPDRSKLKEFSPEEQKRFMDTVLPAHRPRVDTSQIHFFFTKVRVSSKRRADAVADISKDVAERLDAQDKAYFDGLALLTGALSDRSKVKEGARLGSLDPEILASIAASSKHYREAFGFASDAEWQRFLENATVKSASTVPTLAIGFKGGVVVPRLDVGRGG